MNRPPTGCSGRRPTRCYRKVRDPIPHLGRFQYGPKSYGGDRSTLLAHYWWIPALPMGLGAGRYSTEKLFDGSLDLEIESPIAIPPGAVGALERKNVQLLVPSPESRDD
jgi:hypothetical protein